MKGKTRAEITAEGSKKRKRKRKKTEELCNKARPKNKSKKNKKNNEEFVYLDDIELDVLKEQCGDGYIVIDPGKRDLFTAMDKDQRMLQYSNRQHRFRTKKDKYERILLNHKKRLGITKLEESVSEEYTQRTVDAERFLMFFLLESVFSFLYLLSYTTCTRFASIIKRRAAVDDELLVLYSDPKFRQYRWYGYLERKRADDNMLNQVEKTFGKNIVVLYGDWSQRQQMRYFAPTPNKRIKRKLAERFRVYNLDEYRTSKLYWKTSLAGNNLSYKDKTGKTRKIHAVKTFKNGNVTECINRDRNACLNMLKLVGSYLETGEWLPEYTRTTGVCNPSGPSTDTP